MVLNAAGKDSEEHWMTSMLCHWLSMSAVVRMASQHKLVTLTQEDHRSLASKTMPKGRAAHIMRRLLFHPPTMRLIAQSFAARTLDCTEAQAMRQLRQIRHEVKVYAHVAQSGLILPSDPGLPALPKRSS